MSGSTGIVVFSFTAWEAVYPELAYVGAGPAAHYFQAATMLLDNTPASPVTDYAQPGGQREFLLYLLTAHIAKLLAPLPNGNPASDLVGRINSASKGSVSVSAEMPIPPTPDAAWYNQTRYGAMYWAATTQYRRGPVYAPGWKPGPLFGYGYPVFGGRGWR